MIDPGPVIDQLVVISINSQRIPEVNLMLVSTSSALYYLTNTNLNLFGNLFYLAFSGNFQRGGLTCTA